MKDSKGHDDDELIAIQTEHLLLWGRKLHPDVIGPVSEYVIAQNQPSDSTGQHRVFRGQDLVQIIMEWPNLGPYYPKPGSELI